MFSCCYPTTSAVYTLEVLLQLCWQVAFPLLIISRVLAYHIPPFFTPIFQLSSLTTSAFLFLNLRYMSSYSSGTPNGLPWLPKDNFLKWQEQVMAYLQHKQITQYIQGWMCYLPPDPPTDLTAAELLIPTTVQTHVTATAAWRVACDNWKIKDNMAMGAIKGTLHGQYLTYVLSCMMSKAVWDTILGRLKTQNLGLAVHNTKQLLYSHPNLRGPIEDYLKHFAITNEQLAHIGKALPNSDIVHWMLENLPKEDLSWRSVISSFYMVNPDPDLVTSFQASVAI